MVWPWGQLTSTRQVLLTVFMLAHSVPIGHLHGGCDDDPQLTAEDTRTGRISDLGLTEGLCRGYDSLMLADGVGQSSVRRGLQLAAGLLQSNQCLQKGPEASIIH